MEKILRVMNVHIELDLNIENKENFFKILCQGKFLPEILNSELIEKIVHFELNFE